MASRGVCDVGLAAVACSEIGVTTMTPMCNLDDVYLCNGVCCIFGVPDQWVVTVFTLFFAH